MSKNIFENAEFGDAFRTRDGRKAIYHRHMYHRVHYLICEEYCERIPYNSDGTCVGNPDLDIIGKWNESLSEDELEALAEQCVDDLGLKSVDFCGRHDDTYRALKLAWDGYTNSVSKAYTMGYLKAENRLL